MSRQYSIKDIAKYKAGGEGYGDWIANLNALQQGKGYVTGVPTPEYYIGDVPPQDGGRLTPQYYLNMSTYFHYRVISLRVSKFIIDEILNEGEDDERTIKVIKVVFEVALFRQRPSIIKRLYKNQGILKFQSVDDHQMTRVDFKQIANIHEQMIDFETFLKRNFPIRMWTSDTIDQDKQYVTNRLQEFGLLNAELEEYIGLIPNKFGNLPPGATSFSRGDGYSEWQRNLAKLRGGSYESVLNEHGDKTIERLFLIKVGNNFFILIKTDSNDIALTFDRHPVFVSVKDRSSDNSNIFGNKIEIPLRKSITLKRFLTKHSKNDDTFRNSYEYVFDRIFSNNLITSSDISSFLTLPQLYYDEYSDSSELLIPD